MLYCEECENMLLPVKSDVNKYSCKTCGKIFTIEKPQVSNKNEYKISRKKKKTSFSKDIFAKKVEKTITEEDRRAFEDFTYED